MNGGTAALIALLIVALVWAYSHRRYLDYLGLDVAHGAIPPSSDTLIVHTGNGYGDVLLPRVRESGPMTGPSGAVGGLQLRATG